MKKNTATDETVSSVTRCPSSVMGRTSRECMMRRLSLIHILLYDPRVIEDIYNTGRGGVKVRARWRYDKKENLIEM